VDNPTSRHYSSDRTTGADGRLLASVLSRIRIRLSVTRPIIRRHDGEPPAQAHCWRQVTEPARAPRAAHASLPIGLSVKLGDSLGGKERVDVRMHG